MATRQKTSKKAWSWVDQNPAFIFLSGTIAKMPKISSIPYLHRISGLAKDFRLPKLLVLIQKMNDNQKSKLHSSFFIRGIPHLFFVLLLFAIIVNLTSLWPLRTQSRATGYRGILKKIRVGVVADHRIIIHRRGLYLALSQKAPGINLILPNGCSLDKAQLYGLGRVERIEYRDYDPEKLLAEFDFSSHISVRLYTDRRLGPGPFAIATGKKQPETMIVLKRGDMWHLVDISLLPIDIYL